MHTVPLLDADMNKLNIPPNAGPEVIDLEPTASVIDDGLSPPNRPDGMPGIMPGSRQVSRHPEDWYFSSFGKVFWMCVALLMASFWQGTHVLANGGDGPFYYLNLIMISLTIILEVAVCFSLIHDGTSYMENREDALKAVRLYRIIEFMIYIIMILNISITSAMASS